MCYSPMKKKQEKIGQNTGFNLLNYQENTGFNLLKYRKKQDFICPITGKKQDFAQLQKKLEKIVVKYRKNRKQLADNVRQTISEYL